ncbi:glycosyltransferase [Chromobacterium violaceum]|uniref:glycosyltransferase n=1 Tax=Chromobacterium violaceum TaxID=536 RepID=UPI0035A72D77
MKINYYCTLFDRNYLVKGLVMLQTLLQHSKQARVFVLCMDSETEKILAALRISNVTLLTLKDVEDDDLLRVKSSRSIAEYCWTMSACFCWHIMSCFSYVDRLTYLDADLMFFSSVDPLFDEIGDNSIAIIEHRFSERFKHLEAYGRFNVEWVTFVRDSAGVACLKKWRDQCIEWCFARLEDGRMGDQKYLDYWPAEFPGRVHIIQNIGAGVAPWNYSDYKYTIQGDCNLVNGHPLIFYHFHQFQILTGGFYDYMSESYSKGFGVPIKVYKSYENELIKAFELIRNHFPEFNGGVRSVFKVKARKLAQKMLPIEVKNFLRKMKIQMW